MTSVRWQRLQQLVNAALEIEPAERPGFIERACEGDEVMRRQVQDLVDADEAAGSFLEAAVHAGAQAALTAVPAAGSRIGAYRTTSVIGQGGMGVVYRATRADDQFQHDVAIKLVRTALIGTPEVLARFRSERQFLANLNHPNICRLLDGGATDDGSPYVVMEYVPGKPIDQYCADHRLSIRERLQLFQQVADAVQYAHQNVIVHRDIKPANILVNDAGVPKLLDFGIAKIVATDVQRPAITAAGDRLMTPQYASPEQIRGEPITTSTDIYSLGALLYELMAGQPAFALKDAPYGQMERDICERVPDKPSSVAHSRALEGDLDRIILKALHKEPQRRYVSAAEFSDDIGRYLNGFPVTARPDSWRYRANRFVRRHRLGVAAAVVFVLAIIAFGVGMAVLRSRAQEEARTTGQVTDFLVNLFESNDPGQIKGENVTTRQLLDRAALRIENQLQNDPVVQARLFDTVGSLYDALGLWPQAEALLKKALYLREHKLPRDDLALANTLHELGSISSDLNRFDQGERSYREALRLYQSKLGPDNLKVAASLDDLGLNLAQQGHIADAEKFFRQSVEMNTRLSSAKDPETLRALHNLAGTLRMRGDYVDAEPLARQFIHLSTENGGRVQESVGFGWNGLAVQLDELGRFAEAERASRESIDIFDKLYGADHPVTAMASAVLSHTLMRTGKLDEARRLAVAALVAEMKVVGANNIFTAYAQECLGSVVLAQGDAVQARGLFQSALDARIALEGKDKGDVADSWMNVGGLNRATENLPAAGDDFQHALDIRRTKFGRESIFSADAEVAFAEVLIAQKAYARAEELSRHALAADKAGYPPRHFAVGAAESALGWAHLQQGRNHDACPLLEDAHAIAESVFGPEHPETAHAAVRLAACLSVSGGKGRAMKLIEAARPVLDRSPDPTWHADRETLMSLQRDFRRKS